MRQSAIKEDKSLDGQAHPSTALQARDGLTSAIGGIHELDELLTTALHKVLELLDAEKGAIHLLNEDGQELSLHTQRGLSPQYVKAYPRLKVGEQAAGRVADTRRPVLISDSTGDSGTIRTLGGEDFQSLICVPLLSKAVILGTLTLLTSKGKYFAATDVEVLNLLAGEIAAAVQSASVVKVTRRRVDELAALDEIRQATGATLDLVQVLKTVAQKTAQVCRVDRCSVLLLDEEKRTLVPMMSQFASGAANSTLWNAFKTTSPTATVDEVPVVAEVIRQGKTVILDESSRSRLPARWTEPFGIRSLLLVPLPSREEIIGLMALDCTTEGCSFTTQQVHLATTIGNQVAMAIDNARLYARQKRRTNQLNVINQVGQRSASSLDLDELLQQTATAIQEAFNYDFVAILVKNEATKQMEQLAEAGSGSQVHTHGYRQRIDEGLIGRAVTEGDAMVVNDVGQDSNYVEGFPDKPFTKSELVVPIRVGPHIAAALDIQSAEPNAFDDEDSMSMQAIADQLSVSLRNARLYEEIRAHLTDLEAMNRQLVALQETGASLARTLDLQQVLQNIVDGVVKGLGYSLAAIGVIDAEEMVVENIIVSGLNASQIKAIEHLAGSDWLGMRLPLEPPTSVMAKAVTQREVLITDQLHQLSSSVFDEIEGVAIQELLGFGSIVTVPLTLEDEPLGVLCAATDRTEVTDEELASLQAFANQATLAIENAQLYERTRTRLDELSTLHEISVAATSTLDLDEILVRTVDALEQTLGLPSFTLMLIDEKEQRLKVTAGAGYTRDVAQRVEPKIGEGIAGWVALAGEPLSIPDVAADPRYTVEDDRTRSVVCVPLAVGNRIIGVLNVEGDQPMAFSQDTVRFLSTLAGQLAVIIENARLFQRVAQGERDWEDTFKAITDGIAIYDSELTILRANPALAGILNTPLEALVGKRCFEVFSYCPGPTSASCPHRLAMQTGEPTSIEFEEPGLGKTLHIFSFPILDDEGAFKGTVHTVRDTTQENALRVQLLQTEKLAAIGELVSGVAHELNNPLTSVMGYAQLLLAADVSPEVTEDLRTIYQEAQRSAKIIDNLLTFARKETAEKRYTDVNQILRDTLELRAYQLRVDDVELAVELDEELPWTMAAPHQMQQVFLNLINNAHQAMMQSNRPRHMIVRSDSDGEVIRVRVTDSGPGISEEHIGKIFDPFFTTKDVGQGTGLGLSIAFGIVQEHDGRIYAESDLTSGTTFTVELPVVRHPLDSRAQSSGMETADSLMGKRILIIDDEEEILEVISRILERMGHQALALTSAEKALDELDSEQYDLVICDVRMPGMDGKGFYQKVRSSHPELTKRIIFTTGDTLSLTTRAFLDSAKTPCVSKPFSIEDLQLAIEDVLGGDPKAV